MSGGPPLMSGWRQNDKGCGSPSSLEIQARHDCWQIAKDLGDEMEPCLILDLDGERAEILLSGPDGDTLRWIRFSSEFQVDHRERRSGHYRL